MEILLRFFISFFVFLLYIRIWDKKQMNQIAYFNYITGMPASKQETLTQWFITILDLKFVIKVSR